MTHAAYITDGYAFTDSRMRFSLELPDWWRPYVEARSAVRFGGASRALRFLFRYEGRTYGDVLTIFAFPMNRKRWKRLYDDSPFVLLGEFEGRVYAYLVPGELPYAFIDPETGEYDEKKYGEPIRILRKMVNDDVPDIVETFRYHPCRQAVGPGGAPLPAPFLAPIVTRGRAACRP